MAERCAGKSESVIKLATNSLLLYTVEEIFNGNKYSVMAEVVKEILLSGPYESAEDEQTVIEMAYVKHTVLVLEKMQCNGDTVAIT